MGGMAGVILTVGCVPWDDGPVRRVGEFLAGMFFLGFGVGGCFFGVTPAP